jgi:hypothetical protein
MKASGAGHRRPRRPALAGLLALAAGAGCAPLGLLRPGDRDTPEVLDVVLRDDSIDVWPSLVGPGRLALEVSNRGALEHGFRVVGPGLDEPSDESLGPGEHRRMWLKVLPGTYRLFCPDGKHAAQGMSAALTVIEKIGWFRR